MKGKDLIRTIQAGLGFLFRRPEKYLGYLGADQVETCVPSGRVHKGVEASEHSSRRIL